MIPSPSLGSVVEQPESYGLPPVDSSLEDVDPTLEIMCLPGLVLQTPSFAVGSSCSAGVRLAGAGGS